MPLRISKRLIRWPLWAMLVSVTACSTPTPCVLPTLTPVTKVIVDWCAVDKPITFDRLKDTDETILEVKSHNAKWAAQCGGGPQR
jgi:hypothetical protein